jgi:hypothetical protein
MDYKIDKWIRITSNLKLKIFNNPDPDLADKTRFWLKRIYVKSNSSSGILYHSYRYEIYDPFLNNSEITEQNLICNSIYEDYIYPAGSRTVFVVKTPDGEIRHIPVEMSELFGKERSILEGYKFMLIHGHLHSWEAVNFSMENFRLKNKIDDLEKENEEQKKIINELKQQMEMMDKGDKK